MGVPGRVVGLRRGGRSLLTGLLVLLHALGLLLLSVPRDLAEGPRPPTFRCAGHGCGCRTPAMCRLACCCFRPAQGLPAEPPALTPLQRRAFRMAWAGVRPCRAPTLVASAEGLPVGGPIVAEGRCGGGPVDPVTRRPDRIPWWPLATTPARSAGPSGVFLGWTEPGVHPARRPRVPERDPWRPPSRV